MNNASKNNVMLCNYWMIYHNWLNIQLKRRKAAPDNAGQA